MNNATMFKLGYGLYALSTKDGTNDNACIINTAMQITSTPNRICVVVNKANYTHDMIVKTEKFNLSMLTVDTDFDVFKKFGFVSGKETNKFDNYNDATRSNNGILYLTKNTNGYISGSVINKIDVGTHTMFIADVVDGDILSDQESLTYAYYHKHVKPQPKKVNITGYRCKICGYVHEGENLPEDIICPLCKHGAIDFEQI